MWIERNAYEGLMRRALQGDIAGDRIADLKAQLNDVKDELVLQKERVDREQIRADSALHSMTAQKTGIAVEIPMVKPSVDEPDPHEEVPNIVEEMRVDIRERGAMTVLEESRPKH